MSNYELKPLRKENETLPRALPMFTHPQIQNALWKKYGRSTVLSTLRRALDWNDAWGYDDVLLRQLEYAESIAPPLRHPLINRAKRSGSPHADEIARLCREMIHDKHVAQGHALVERLRREFSFPVRNNPYDELAHAMGHVAVEAIRVAKPDVHLQLTAVGALLGGSKLSNCLGTL